MIQFLTPIAFSALLALGVPVLIHLWSRGGGRRVRVGSLRFLQETERRQWHTIRLSQIPLLLLRLLLLSLVVLLLAQPVWVSNLEGVEEQADRWVLVHPEVIRPPVQPGVYRTLDSLTATGASVHVLAPEFPVVDIDETVPFAGATVDSWSLLREVDEGLPKGSTITVVGPNRFADFRGIRPALRSSVAWIDVGSPAPNRWIAAAQWMDADSLEVMVGLSTPTRTLFSQYRVEVSDSEALMEDVDGLAVDLDKNRERLVLRPPDAHPHDDALSISPADQTRRIVVAHSAERRDDARYIEAALRAVAEWTRRPLSITRTETDTLSETADVLFWLHENPIPEAVKAELEADFVLVCDARGAAWQAVRRRVLMERSGLGTAPTLTRRVAAVRRAEVLWRDSAGEPLLERETSDKGAQYWYHSRFHPSTGSLVRSTAFPEWIGSLLYDGVVPTLSGDRRRLSVEQRKPLLQTEARVHESNPTATRLHKPLWLLLFALFAVERWVAYHRTA